MAALPSKSITNRKLKSNLNLDVVDVGKESAICLVIINPFLQILIVGMRISFHDIVPNRLCISQYPRISPGTAIESGPI